MYLGACVHMFSGVVYSSPALSADGKSVLVGSNDGFIYMASLSTGQQLWKVGVLNRGPDGAAFVDGSPAVTQGSLSSPSAAGGTASFFIGSSNGDIFDLSKTRMRHLMAHCCLKVIKHSMR